MAFFCASSALNSEVAVSLSDCCQRACALASASRVMRSWPHQSWNSGWEIRLRSSEGRTGRIRDPSQAAADALRGWREHERVRNRDVVVRLEREDPAPDHRADARGHRLVPHGVLLDVDLPHPAGAGDGEADQHLALEAVVPLQLPLV